MADKRLDSMNEYEQLKRKNRRRLVGASAMVLVAGIVFGVAVNGGDEGEIGRASCRERVCQYV